MLLTLDTLLKQTLSFVHLLNKMNMFLTYS